MQITQELSPETIGSSHPQDLIYQLARNQCEEVCQNWGGIRDSQIHAIVNDLSGLPAPARASYYWQLRLNFPNPYE